jgi:hypothetical protein
MRADKRGRAVSLNFRVNAGEEYVRHSSALLGNHATLLIEYQETLLSKREVRLALE